MTTTDTYQLFCRRCFDTFAAPTLAEALAKVERHERECWNKPAPAPPPQPMAR